MQAMQKGLKAPTAVSSRGTPSATQNLKGQLAGLSQQLQASSRAKRQVSNSNLICDILGRVRLTATVPDHQPGHDVLANRLDHPSGGLPGHGENALRVKATDKSKTIVTDE